MVSRETTWSRPIRRVQVAPREEEAAPVAEQEASNSSSPQVLDGGTTPGASFFTFFDPNVGNVLPGTTNPKL